MEQISWQQNEVLTKDLDAFRVVDMRSGKVNDDGYRGIHLYKKRRRF